MLYINILYKINIFFVGLWSCGTKICLFYRKKIFPKIFNHLGVRGSPKTKGLYFLETRAYRVCRKTVNMEVAAQPVILRYAGLNRLQ